MENFKKCIKCLNVKLIKEFHTDNRLKDKHKGRCKLCTNEFLLYPGVREKRLLNSSRSLKKAKENLTDNYVVRALCHHNDLTPNQIRELPKLIEITKIVMLTNRIIKNEKNNNSNRFKK